jgi:type I restriction enzyme S subunit
MFHHDPAHIGLSSSPAPETNDVLWSYQTDYFISNLTKLSIGAGYPAVSDEDILDTEIPLPPLAEQQRIASLLTRADRLRRLRRHARELSDSLLQSVFLEMFGDPKTNPRGWEKTKIRDVTTIIVPTRDKPKKFSGDIPWITLPDLDGLFISNAKYLLTKEDAAEVGTRLMPSNTVLLSCAGSLGKVAVTTRSVYSNQQFYGLIAKPNVLDYFFLAMQLKIFGEEFYFNMAGMSTLGFFSKDKALDIEIILPPLALQEQFAGVVARHESLRRRQAESARQAEGLFQSMLSEAFRG